ncbi:mast cell protease 1A-like [Scomber japonicus]|uniref:mast cell protease 1A-like n=1 Tax=Scomber japonicus TaxID=13676 RepID=UPI0023068B6C|nr:mast cell protease 1A-like [Scomber japonicus]
MMHTYCIIFVFQLLSLSGAMESGIVDGKKVKPHSRPYMASLQVDGSHKCGGMLIREDFVLTAAHCKLPQQMMVVLGAQDITKKEKSQQRIQVKYHPYPKYKKGQYDNDIMLLEMTLFSFTVKKNATLNKYVKTIGLPKKDEKIPDNIQCAVAGWGRKGKKNLPSHILRETMEKTQSSNECTKTYGKDFKADHMICTAFTKKKGGFCQGDSGGPLICNNKLQGIIAFTAKDCNDPKYPHGSIKIQAFLPWMKKVMQGSGDTA